MAKPPPRDRRPEQQRTPAPADATAFQRWSAPLLVRLTAMPRWSFVIVLAVVTFAGLMLDGILGGLLLLLLAALLAWLAALGWPTYNVAARLLRVVVVALVLYVAASKLFGFGQ
ncbi:MAG: DUF6703 family protein [Actinomycetes bacterium]